MTLSNALSSSVSGLSAASTAISVIGDNIANGSTPGFKEKRAEFSSVLGQSITSGAGFAQIGAGTRTNNVGTIFSQGTFESTGRNTDLGIEGRGFFVLDTNQGRSFSRAGIFGFDANGTLVDPAGNRVQGYGVDPTTGVSNGILGDISIATALAPPATTGQMQLSLNLNASEAVTSPFDPANADTTSSSREVITIYDSLGTPRQATIFFSKSAANTWEYNVALPDAEAGTPTGDPWVVQGTGTLNFDPGGSGTLLNMSGSTTPPTVTFDLNSSNGAAASQAVVFSLGPMGGVGTGGPTTQFNSRTVTNNVSQDGFSAGTLSALEIDESGFFNGVFTNGATIPLAQLALANFGNVEGLSDIGGSRLAESISSGPAVISGANSGNVGSIRSSSLENSNVDLASQFVKLIVSQRAFQANTRTVSVANELMANLVSLGQ